MNCIGTRADINCTIGVPKRSAVGATRQRVDREAEIVVGVEPDTTMRDRRQAGSNSNTHNSLQVPAAFVHEPAQVERIFWPE